MTKRRSIWAFYFISALLFLVPLGIFLCTRPLSYFFFTPLVPFSFYDIPSVAIRTRLSSALII